MDYTQKTATITGDHEEFRWELGRRWSYGARGVLTFVMLNPSSADAMADDPTIRRCVGFADCAGYSGINVINLFPYRTRSPKKLRAWVESLHPVVRAATLFRSAQYATHHALSSDIVFAWGNHGVLYDPEVNGITSAVLDVSKRAFHLGPLTDLDQPRHPLYLPSSSPWNAWAA